MPSTPVSKRIAAKGNGSLPPAKRSKVETDRDVLMTPKLNLEAELERIMSDSECSTMCPSSPSTLSPSSSDDSTSPKPMDFMMQTPPKKRAMAQAAEELLSPPKTEKPRTVPVVGRTSERCKLDTFLEACIEGKSTAPAATPKALYVSGGPGTGKTCCVRAAVSELMKRVPATRLVEVNCMLLQQRTLKGVMCHIADAVAGAGGVRAVRSRTEQQVAGTTAKQLAKLRSTDAATPAPIVLVVDEVDQLVRRSGGQAAATAEAAVTLEGVFSLPQLAVENQRVAVIAIANAVDLLERPAARALLTKGLASSLLFEPYTADQLRDIFKFHLSQTEHGKIAEQALGRVGLETRVRSAAKISGSCRTLLGFCHQVLRDVAAAQEENDVTMTAAAQQSTAEADQSSKKAGTESADAVMESAQTAAVAAVASAAAVAPPAAPTLLSLKGAPKTNQNDPLACLKEMPVEQQIMLCTLARSKAEVVKMTDICNGFRELCLRLQQPATLACKGNVLVVLNVLEARGLLEMRELRAGRPGRSAGAPEKIAELNVSRKALKRSLGQANQLLAKYVDE
eukprot:TRINITY_DN7197_c0_g1_i1.p1 TRINITY_DN7197_c0_g1~~TRINITY_DN7197_c0_g1_i1.p1  ORF type:complete len:566 (-),score=151.20 TRINITY_DN7197_c0_g1_i1:677-2374(-)